MEQSSGTILTTGLGFESGLGFAEVYSGNSEKFVFKSVFASCSFTVVSTTLR